MRIHPRLWSILRPRLWSLVPLTFVVGQRLVRVSDAVWVAWLLLTLVSMVIWALYDRRRGEDADAGRVRWL